MSTSRKPHPKAKFTTEEDSLLRCLVGQFGEDDWKHISHHMPDRNARQCKDRWLYYLSPNVHSNPWTDDEDVLLLEKVRAFGQKWVRIAAFFPTRTDIQIKNRFLVLSRRKKREIEAAPVHGLPFPFPMFVPEACDSIPPLLLRQGRQEARERTGTAISCTKLINILL
jgi:hypothetical protein